LEQPGILIGYDKYDTVLHYIKNAYMNLVENPRWRRWSNHDKRIGFWLTHLKIFKHNFKKVQMIATPSLPYLTL